MMQASRKLEQKPMLGTSIIIDKKTQGPPVKLSLVALMDIFTILVFFLLLNSGDSQTLEDAKFVTLPDSSSETSPHSDLVIHVGMDELWMDNKKVVDVKDISVGEDKPIELLAKALEDFVSKHGDLSDHEKENGLSITIMADKSVPYAVLKSVMATCSGQDFRDISLAVNRVAAQVFGGANDAFSPPVPTGTVSTGAPPINEGGL